VNAATGVEIGDNDFRLSNMGPDGDSDYFANSPAVACGSATAQVLVVWEGDDNTPPLEDGEIEIFGQRVGTLAAGYRMYLPLVKKPG